MARPADPLARSKLLAAAREVFAKAGLADARVEDIARRAGVAKGSFYLHFKSKDEAFQALLDHFLLETARFNAACAGDFYGLPDAGAVRAFLCDHDAKMLDFLWGNRDILTVFYQAAANPHYQPLIDAFLDAQVEVAAAQIRGLQARGLYRADLDAEVVAICIVGAYHSLTRRLVQARTRPDLAAAARTVVSMLLDGLTPRPNPIVDPSVNDRTVIQESPCPPASVG